MSTPPFPAPTRRRIVLVRTVVTATAAAAVLFCWLFARASAAELLRLWPELDAGGRALHAAQIVVVLLLPGGAALLSLALVWFAEDRAESRALALFLGLVSFAPTADALAAGIVRPLAGDVGRDLTYVARDIAFLLSGAALLRFTALFPRPLAAADVGHGPLRRLRVALLDDGRLWRAAAAFAAGSSAAMLLVEAGIGKDAARLLLPFQIVLPGVLALTLAVANLRAGRHELAAEERRRLGWVLQGFVAATAVILLASSVKAVQLLGGYRGAAGSWYVFVVVLGLDLLVVFLAVAMFYHGAFDPRLAIRRTAVAGLVGTAMVFLFVGVEQLLEETLRAWVGFGDRAGGIVTGGVVALSFEPVKRRVAAVVEGLLARDAPPSVRAAGSAAVAVGDPKVVAGASGPGFIASP